MQIRLLTDLIKDEYGNFYHGVRQTTGKEYNEITLVNAFMDYTFSRIISEDFIKDYNRQFLGKLPTKLLKGTIESINDGKVPLKIISMSDVIKNYDKIVIWNVYEKNAGIDIEPKISVYHETTITR
ncbi:hypothetical protein [Clostridium sp. BNL1100]|uniref:hypothetical protein n=1 Tax=Clostridium sp. BNL1100 TaxID=755731 RepID=UPI00024A7A9C|nr:hypothetical protein [Clostridium sp. BNL1100]AEY66612.1 hypothetical protein Clo1100_2441 [Clostridium sp. BNL1100]